MAGSPLTTRLILYLVDRSGSTENIDVTGEVKEKIIYETLNEGHRKFFEKLGQELAQPQGGELKARAQTTYLAIGYFGEEGYDDSKDYLFELPTGRKVDTLARIYEAGGANINVVDENAYYGVHKDGTDFGQAMKAVESALRMLRAQTDSAGRLHLRTWTILITDGCYNRLRGHPLSSDDVYKKLHEAGVELNTMLTGMSRGIITIIYGDPRYPEDDRHICPVRTALISSRLDEVDPSIRGSLSELERSGVLERNNEIFDLEVPFRGGRVRDYAVWRISDLSKLADVVFKTTTNPAQRG